MKKYSLLQLLSKAAKKNEKKIDTHEIINLSDEIIKKIYGGLVNPTNNGCSNSSCTNASCNSNNNSKNETCTNSSCTTNGMTNTGCTNTSCN